MQINEPVPTPQTVAGAGHGIFGYLSAWEFILSCEVLLFGLLVLFVIFLLYRRRHATPEDILKTIAVVLVVIGSLFAMTAGFSSAQIAPIIGLFGTIVGYVIGRRSDARENLQGPQGGQQLEEGEEK